MNPAAAGLFALLPENTLPVLFGAAALGLVVFLHELGHFVVAKACGIRVEVFSIGFPPRMCGFRFGETEYRLSWILFGGYVKLAGMEYEKGVDPRGVERGYHASPLWVKLAVCACGPAMNILTAFLFFTYLYAAGFPVPANMESTVIGAVVAGSPAERAGLAPGDRVLAVNGRPVERWEEVNKSIVYATTPAVEIAYSRDGARRVERIVPEADERLRLKRIGILPADLLSFSVMKDSPAAEGGMRDGDFIVSAGGERIYSFDRLLQVIRAHDGQALRLGLLRAGKPAAATVVPRELPAGIFPAAPGAAGPKGPAIGVALRTSVGMDELEANGLVVYIYRDPFTWMARNLQEMYLTLRGLLMRAISPRGLAGAIGIVQIMSYFMRAGFRQFAYIMAVISVNLGVLNLLPIPVLDGGHIAVALVEGVRRRPLSATVMAALQNVFVALLIAFMLLVSANDVVRIWGEKIAWLMEKPPAAEKR